jgi:L-fuculose-phosphate aldolase
MAITPSGVAAEDLDPKGLSIISLDGKTVEAGSTKPSMETGMHCACYLSKPGTQAIVHTHSPYATAFAVRGIPIPPVTFEAGFYGASVGLVPVFPPGSAELAQAIRAPLAQADVVLLQSHGVLVCGQDIEEALLRAEYVERVAKVAILAGALAGVELPSLL